MREPLKIAFVTRTSEIFVSEAEVKNRRRRSFNYVEDDFWPITMLTKIAAVRSKNEFLEVPIRFQTLKQLMGGHFGDVDLFDPVMFAGNDGYRRFGQTQ